MRAYRKALHACLLISVAFLVSGCVYLRLLEVKRQMASFDAHFAIETENGMRISCRKPVLLTRDIRWIGLAPEKATTSADAEHWRVRWVKEMPAGVQEDEPYDIVLELLFAHDRLEQINIPERYFAAMPKQLLIELLRSLGGARVDKSDRAVEALLATAKPDLPGIEKLLGRPSRTQVKEAETIYHYRYVPSTATGLARSAVFDIAVHFENGSDELLRWEGTTPVGKIGFNFEKTGSGGRAGSE